MTALNEAIQRNFHFRYSDKSVGVAELSQYASLGSASALSCELIVSAA